jgi:serine phosphatase RsbU (regulator of sigma subunit)/HAMP domain-containing protein
LEFRFTIGRKIFTGFGIFIFFIVLVLFFTNDALDKSRSVNREINEVYNPSIDKLQELKLKIVRSQMLITYWGLVQSRRDNQKKQELDTLIAEGWPSLKDSLNTLSSEWTAREKEDIELSRKELLQKIFDEIEGLFRVHETIRNSLSSFDSYQVPSKRLMVLPKVESGGEVHRQTKNIVQHLDDLIQRQKNMTRDVRGEMIASFDTLQFLVRYVGIGLSIAGLLIAIFTVRSIVRPVKKLKSILLSLGRGIFPEHRIQPTNDEIGEMSEALNDLVDGLKRTTDFSKQVGAGNFDYDFEPLSPHDTLGHALLKMRDDLAENERILEEKVRQRTQEVVEQKQKVEGLYKDLTDSIRYAKRLQSSILPSDEWIDKKLPSSFVLFKPKDIVSGDFYWFEESVNGKIIFSAVDCTGHGVPGAFMSLVGHNGLHQAVNEHGMEEPGAILDDLNRSAKRALTRTSEGESVSDGMDMALCTIDKEARKLEFSGANNPLYLVRNGELHEYKADKVPIGGEGEHRYNTQRLDLQKGDVLYVFSDGFPDQFGGPKGKKFKYRPFKELLISISDKPMQEQKEILDRTIEEWKGDLEQIDDILVIGVTVE